MSSYSKDDVILVRYPFSNLFASKVRPAVVVSAPHVSQDVFVVPLTSNTMSLFPGEFVLADWRDAGLNVPTAVKRGLYTAHVSSVAKAIGRLSESDAKDMDASLRGWLGI